jgi:hypothetical protein
MTADELIHFIEQDLQEVRLHIERSEMYSNRLIVDLSNIDMNRKATEASKKNWTKARIRTNSVVKFLGKHNKQ